MDFKSNFWQVKVAPDLQQYTAFTVGNLGFYEFTHMNFGMLGELNLMYCIIYLDNVIVFGCTEEEHLECLCIVFEWFCEFNLKLKPSKCSFFQSAIVYLARHVSREGICPSWDIVHVVEEFPMPETYTQVHTFCRLMGHYRHFIKGFAHIAQPLHDVFGKEVKMSPVQLPLEVREAVRILKDKIQTAPVLVLLDYDKPFLLDPNASKKGLGAMLSQKQDDGHYHPVTFGSCSLMHSEKNYHSSKLEFLTLKWSVTEHFKEYLTYVPFVVRTDNNPLTYVLTTPNLDATGNRWVGVLASVEFTLEYQKGADNGGADTMSHVPICHNQEMVQSLLEGTIVGAIDRGEAEVSEGLLGKHECLGNKAWVQAMRMAPMHIVNWAEAQEADPW